MDWADHEAAAINAFVVPIKRERFISLLGSSRRRKKATAELAHFGAFDPRFMTAIPSRQQTAEQIAQLLRAYGAGQNCWVMSEIERLDRRVMNLNVALNQIVGSDAGTLVSCIAGKLCYFENEDARFILRRPD